MFRGYGLCNLSYLHSSSFVYRPVFESNINYNDDEDYDDEK